MNAIKFPGFFLLFVSFLLANDQLEDLYKQASFYENQKEYKKAMEIYKKIAIEEKNANRIYFDEEKQIAHKIATETLDKIDDEETEKTIQQILAKSFDLYAYEENYFLPFSYDSRQRDDRKQTEAKFQFSVKKPIISNFLKMNETFYFGYSQTSLWQLYEDSSPFRETSYRPELFVELPYGKKGKTVIKGFKFGFLHESNGQPVEKSRSWNRLYLTSYFQLGNLFIAPKVWYRIPEEKNDDDNPDIEKYLGYGDLTLVLPYKSHTFKLLFRNNLRFNEENKGFVQLDWTFPLLGSKSLFAYVQASSGYGDSLIDYDKEINRFSFGISLSR